MWILWPQNPKKCTKSGWVTFYPLTFYPPTILSPTISSPNVLPPVLTLRDQIQFYDSPLKPQIPKMQMTELLW